MSIKVNRRALKRLGSALEARISTVPKSQRKLRRFEVRARNGQDAYRSPAELLVAAALANRTRWDRIVKPRLKRFRSRHRGVQSIAELRALVDSMGDRSLYRRVLYFGSGENPRNYRGPLLRGLARAFDEYGKKLRGQGGKLLTDYQILRAWAREPDPRLVLEEANGGKVLGLGPKLVDWLRMYGGDVPTVPADVYTVKGMKELGLGDAGKTAEFVARLFGISPHALDLAFRAEAGDGRTR